MIADAAIRVLAEHGARGLSHRAVDSAAGLPEGSTSNYFNSRDALLEAALERHLELDTPPRVITREVVGPLRLEQTRALLLAALERRLDPDRRQILLARYELFLESTRRPAFRERLLEAHLLFVGLLAALLDATGCATPRAHAVELLAALDGAVFTQLIFAERGLERAETEELLDRMLASC